MSQIEYEESIMKENKRYNKHSLNIKYMWLQNMCDVDYRLYRELMHAFHSIENIYKFSKDKNILDTILKKKKIFLPIKIYKKIINNELKILAENIYYYLCKCNIYVINYEELRKIFTFNEYVPLVIYAYGDISVLDRIKTYVYKDKLSKYGEKTYNMFCSKISLSKNVSIVSDSLDMYTNILYTNCIMKVDREELLVISNNFIKDFNIKYEFFSSFCDNILILEASYNEKINKIVDSFLENSKNIYVVPNNIFNEYAYFSNYLIKDGALVITSAKEFIESIVISKAILKSI